MVGNSTYVAWLGMLGFGILVTFAVLSLKKAKSTEGTLENLTGALAMIAGLIVIAFLVGGSPHFYQWQRVFWGDQLGMPTAIGHDLNPDDFNWDPTTKKLKIPAIPGVSDGNALVVSYDFGNHIHTEIYKKGPEEYDVPPPTAAITAYLQNIKHNSASRLVSIPRRSFLPVTVIPKNDTDKVIIILPPQKDADKAVIVPKKGD